MTEARTGEYRSPLARVSLQVQRHQEEGLGNAWFHGWRHDTIANGYICRSYQIHSQAAIDFHLKEDLPIEKNRDRSVERSGAQGTVGMGDRGFYPSVSTGMKRAISRLVAIDKLLCQ